MLPLLCLLFMLVTGAGFCDLERDATLDRALKSRISADVETVIRNFRNSANALSCPHRISSVLLLLGDYLLQKKQWVRAIEIFAEVLSLDALANTAALYGMAKAHLGLGIESEAKNICVYLVTKNPRSNIVAFAGRMMELAPKSLDARLGRYMTMALLRGERLFALPSSIRSIHPNVLPATGAANPLAADRLESRSGDSSADKEGLEMIASDALSQGDEVAGTAPVRSDLRPAQPMVSEQPEPRQTRWTLEAHGWNSDVTGHIDAEGMNLDLDADTDFSTQSHLAYAGRWDFSQHDQLRLEYGRFDHDGKLSRAVMFAGRPFDVGAPIQVRSSFFDIGLGFLLHQARQSSWKLLYGTRSTRLLTQLTQSPVAGGRAEDFSSSFLNPYVGIEGHAQIWDHLALTGSAKLYSSLRQSDLGTRMTDFRLVLRFGRDISLRPAGATFYGTLGYRFLLFHGQHDNDAIEPRYSGPTFGMEGHF